MNSQYEMLRALANAGRLGIACAPIGSVDPRLSSTRVVRVEPTSVCDVVDVLAFSDEVGVAGESKQCLATDGADVWMCVGKGRQGISQIPVSANMVYGDDGYTWMKAFPAIIGAIQGTLRRYASAPVFGTTHYANVSADASAVVKIWPSHHEFVARRDADGLYGVFHAWPGVTVADRLYAIAESPTFNTTRLPNLKVVVETGSISSVEVVDGGSGLLGYSVNHVFGDGTGAQFAVNIVAGSIISVDVLTAGSGYTWCDLIVASEMSKVFPSVSRFWDDLVDVTTSIYAVVDTPTPCEMWLVACNAEMKKTVVEGAPSMAVITKIGKTTSASTEVNIGITSEA